MQGAAPGTNYRRLVKLNTMRDVFGRYIPMILNDHGDTVFSFWHRYRGPRFLSHQKQQEADIVKIAV